MEDNIQQDRHQDSDGEHRAFNAGAETAGQGLWRNQKGYVGTGEFGIER